MQSYPVQRKKKPPLPFRMEKKGRKNHPRYHPGLLLERPISGSDRSALPIGQKRSRAMFAAAAGLLFTNCSSLVPVLCGYSLVHSATVYPVIIPDFIQLSTKEKPAYPKTCHHSGKRAGDGIPCALIAQPAHIDTYGIENRFTGAHQHAGS